MHGLLTFSPTAKICDSKISTDDGQGRIPEPDCVLGRGVPRGLAAAGSSWSFSCTPSRPPSLSPSLQPVVHLDVATANDGVVVAMMTRGSLRLLGLLSFASCLVVVSAGVLGLHSRAAGEAVNAQVRSVLQQSAMLTGHKKTRVLFAGFTGCVRSPAPSRSLRHYAGPQR